MPSAVPAAQQHMAFMNGEHLHTYFKAEGAYTLRVHGLLASIKVLGLIAHS